MAELRHNFEMIEKVKKGIIGVGWAEIEDLTKYNTREEFQKVLEEVYPEETRKMSIAVQAGMLYRWTHEVNSGDIAIVPMKINNTIKLGRFTGDNPFRDTSLYPYSHVRSVKWIKDCRRSDFTQDALYSIGSALTLSQPADLVKTQIELLIEGKKVSDAYSDIFDGEEKNEELLLWEDQLKDLLDGFIADRIKERKGYDYQEIIAGVLQAIGYHVKLGPRGADGKRDVMAYGDKLGLKDPIIRVEVKSQDSPVGVDEISKLGGYIRGNEKGLFVSRMGFTKKAESYADEKGIILMDGEKIIDLLLENYERLPENIKNWIPLKKVWIPKQEENSPKLEDKM
jgi:restriction system protein